MSSHRQLGLPSVPSPSRCFLTAIILWHTHTKQGASHGPRRSRRCVQQIRWLGGQGRNPPHPLKTLPAERREGVCRLLPRPVQHKTLAKQAGTKKCPSDRRGLPAVLCCCLFPAHRDPPTGLFRKARRPPAVGCPANTILQPLAKLLGASSVTTELHSRN